MSMEPYVLARQQPFKLAAKFLSKRLLYLFTITYLFAAFYCALAVFLIVPHEMPATQALLRHESWSNVMDLSRKATFSWLDIDLLYYLPIVPIVAVFFSNHYVVANDYKKLNSKDTHNFSGFLLNIFKERSEDYGVTLNALPLLVVGSCIFIAAILTTNFVLITSATVAVVVLLSFVNHYTLPALCIADKSFLQASNDSWDLMIDNVSKTIFNFMSLLFVWIAVFSVASLAYLWLHFWAILPIYLMIQVALLYTTYVQMGQYLKVVSNAVPLPGNIPDSRKQYIQIRR